MFFALANLSAQSVQEIKPWEIKVEIPAHASKEIYRKWCAEESTQHFFYCCFSGLAKTIRVSYNNPPSKMYGLVVDYDAPFEGDRVRQIQKILPLELRPQWISTTFSGYTRLVWTFEEPLVFFNQEVHQNFIEKVSKELRLLKLLPGFDKEAFKNWSQYYEIGRDWTALNPLPLLTARLSHWLEQATRKIEWGKLGVQIPIETIREEGKLQFPGRWKLGWDNFSPGQRGCRFWDTGADADSVIVRESGCQCFTGDKSFMSWSDIFGKDFVRRNVETKLGEAIDGIYFDGRNYWRKPDGCLWVALQKGDIENHLKTTRQLEFTRKGRASEIDFAIERIQNQRHVTNAFPFLYKEEGIVEYNSTRFLNISNLRPLPHSDSKPAWGEGFAWLANYFDTLFDPADQKEYFLSWLSHFYSGAVRKKLERGLALFLAGPVGIGKTFLNYGVLGKLMGRLHDASSYLTGSDQFNEALFSAPLWVVDDAVITGKGSKEKFSQLVKRVVANDSFTYRAMYRSGFNMEWLGRVVVTMNDDPDSLQMLPQTEINILDKILLLKVKPPTLDYNHWPDDEDIAVELPFFAAYLRHYEIPHQCKGSSRFKVASYQHPDLLNTARSVGYTANFMELLDMWRSAYFRQGRTEWIGTPTELLSHLKGIDMGNDQCANSIHNVAMSLNKLVKIPSANVFSTGETRRYKILPEKK